MISSKPASSTSMTSSSRKPAKHGFTNLPFEKLVQLRISGLLDDESVKK